MKKKIVFAGVILLWAASVYAAINMTFTIPNGSVSVIMDAFDKLAGTHMTLEARGHHPDPAQEFDGRWDFRIAAKDPNETQKDFAERFTKELIRASVRLAESAKENKRYRDEINEVAPPDVNVPDAIIQ